MMWDIYCLLQMSRNLPEYHFLVMYTSTIFEKHNKYRMFFKSRHVLFVLGAGKVIIVSNQHVQLAESGLRFIWTQALVVEALQRQRALKARKYGGQSGK